ncbi:MAG: minichromosome maintenance protein MCM, partial [Thermoplasmata archaeon]|nr:minichromosome maintenance protein MCM [Thermoplasmata archaeon]
SRFDLIFLLIDKPDMENDRRLAGEIIKRHWIGGSIISRKEGKNINTKDADIDDIEFENVTPEIEKELLRKYIAYSKMNCFPILTKEAREEIVNFYVDLRESNQNSIIGERKQASIPLTARQLEALVRIAEASARMRLSQEATEQDARFAIELMRYSLEQTSRDEMGNIDIDGIFGSGSKSQMDTMMVVVDLIRSLESESKEGTAKKSDLIERAKEVNLDQIDLDNYLNKLRDEGSIYEPKTNHYSFLR